MGTGALVINPPDGGASIGNEIPLKKNPFVDRPKGVISEWKISSPYQKNFKLADPVEITRALVGTATTRGGCGARAPVCSGLPRYLLVYLITAVKRLRGIHIVKISSTSTGQCTFIPDKILRDNLQGVMMWIGRWTYIKRAEPKLNSRVRLQWDHD
ncbi:hypothetical protein EVAR_28783_1 [Eumeta japonica]|uniref:Uncharacterized protein n=1 Tax=Eumeta variegata TaxID=151549 RepID=A0A4C1VGE6_EUMVA|nr:hypothetical protein EVAR_28783_1 [Eumeta japonica]